MGPLINSVIKYSGETYSSVGGSIYLGVNDKVENWREITEEYNALQTAESELREV